MPYSKCIRCENKSFEVKGSSPANANYKIMFVQCRKCGCVIGTMDYLNIGTVVKSLERKTDDNTNKLNRILQLLNRK